MTNPVERQRRGGTAGGQGLGLRLALELGLRLNLKRGLRLREKA